MINERNVLDSMTLEQLGVALDALSDVVRRQRDLETKLWTESQDYIKLQRMRRSRGLRYDASVLKD